MKSDDNFESHISYVIEKYNIYFNSKPNKCDCIIHYLNKCNEDVLFIAALHYIMKKWNITIDNDDFDIFYFTFYFCYYTSFRDSKNNSVIISPTKEKKFSNMINYYNEFFENSESLSNEILSYTLHPILRDELVYYQMENQRVFKLFKIKDKLFLNNLKQL